MGLWDELFRPLVKRLFEPTRQNHALEHATVTILMKRAERPFRVLGGATPDGCFLQAEVPTEEVESAAAEALERMQNGEGHLAVSPFCGTNLAVAGAMAAVACLVVLGTEDRIRRLPMAVAAATGAVLLAQPVGAQVQRHVTTTPDVANLRILRVTKQQVRGTTVHRVVTTREPTSK